MERAFLGMYCSQHLLPPTKSSFLSQSLYIFVLFRLQVPDHTIKDINGASFAGFYYICFQKSKAEMEGYYYHRSSEWYVHLFIFLYIINHVLFLNNQPSTDKIKHNNKF